jgi:AsmA-like protein
VLTWFRRLFVGAAALVALLMGVLLVLEESGLVARFVRERLARELGALGPRFSLQHAELAWFEPGIELVGLELAAVEPGGASPLTIARLHASFSPRLDELLGVSLEGGRVHLGEDLFDDWNRLAAERAARPPAPAPPLPRISLRALEVELELPDRSHFGLGSLTLEARAGHAGGIELAGRFAPALGGALTSPEPVRVSGSLDSAGFQLWTAARDLALVTGALPEGARIPALAGLQGSARLTLDGSFALAFAEAARPQGHLRASLSQGRAVLSPQHPALEELSLELEAKLAPEPGSNPWSRASWDARVALQASVQGTPLWARAELGRNVPAGAWLRAWGRLRAVPTERELLSSLGLEADFAYLREMLAPRGRYDLAATLLLGRERDAELPSGTRWTHDLALQVLPLADSGLAYMGYPGDPGSGLPLQLEDVQGEFLLAQRSSGERPWRMAALDLSAEHGSGRLTGWMQLTAPKRGPLAFTVPELDLVLSTPSIAIDETLLAAIQRNHYVSWIVPDFAPSGGTLGGEFRLRSGPDVGGTSGTASLRLKGASLRWSEVPVPLDGLAGELELRWAANPSVSVHDPKVHVRPIGVDYRFDNRAGPRVGAQASVRGWVREPPLPPLVDPTAPPALLLQEIGVEIDELGLRGRDFDILAARFPALEREVQSYGAVGRMRVGYHGTQPEPAGPFRSDIEATPLEVHVRPQFFQRQTRDLRGRILIRTEDGPEGEVSAAQLVLAGTWPSGVELCTAGTIPAHGEARVEIFGAGIDPTNTSFKGALVTSLSASSPATGGIDLSEWTLAGPVDLALVTLFDPASPAPARNRYLIQLRDNDLSARELVLRNLHGTLEQEDEVMESPLVEATLGGHPLELRAVRTFPLAFAARVERADPWLGREGFWRDPLGRALQADVYTRDLPLDAEHLAGLLDPPALASLRDNPSWRGQLDVLGARLLVTSEADNQGKVAVRGALRPHDLAMSLGLPIRIQSAKVALEELISESGRFRGWARITDLEARIAERELSGASMLAGYVDGRLTMDNLSGDFEGGRLESLGGALGGTSKALGIDLAEPHRFDVAMRLKDVNVGGLLRGVFQSSIADEGVLDASLQLSGTPGEILGLTGRGSLSLDEGALWSIPVMRALFVQLGFDRGGLFDRLRSRFDLRDGRLTVSHLEIQSDLLDLVGEGWQDLDGRLAYDLEVRYGLLDRLGVLGRLLYWLNNNLMRVAVRGDFERPEVKIRNAIVELISGFEDDPPRRLPLPDFSALGPRF